MTLQQTPDEVRDDSAPVLPPPRAGFSMRQAMIVPALGVLILVVFVTIGLVTTKPVTLTNTSKNLVEVPGTPLRATRADAALSVITTSGEPPPNIVNAVSIPQGAVRVSHQNNSAASDQYDEQINLVVNDSQGALLNFYLLDMKHQGWQVFQHGPADHDPGALEVLGKKAGSDGFYWEMGAVIPPTTFGDGAPASGHTQFTIRLFQVPDPD